MDNSIEDLVKLLEEFIEKYGEKIDLDKLDTPQRPTDEK